VPATPERTCGVGRVVIPTILGVRQRR